MNSNNETLLKVSGMRCSSCVRRVSNALGAVDGVDGVEVRLNEGEVVVRHDPARASVEALIAVLDQTGYRSNLGAAA